jgi:hypothetical protein
MTVKDKEQLIIGTILYCNSEIKKLSESINISSENTNLYYYNMSSLLSEINPMIKLNESLNQIPPESIFITNVRNNYFSYFQKVYDFLDGYEPNIQYSLNESLTIDTVKVENPIQLNIKSFKDELKDIINKLSQINDLDKLSPDILKIKTLAKKPIMIYGYDICNNIALKKELLENFNLSEDKLISILFDKINKQLLFITENTSNIVVYDLRKDSLNNYNKINDPIKSEKLNSKNYLIFLKELLDNNTLIEIYKNFKILKLEFTDNLFSDFGRIKEINKMKQESSVIKK